MHTAQAYFRQLPLSHKYSMSTTKSHSARQTNSARLGRWTSRALPTPLPDVLNVHLLVYSYFMLYTVVQVRVTFVKPIHNILHIAGGHSIDPPASTVPAPPESERDVLGTVSAVLRQSDDCG